MSEKLTAVLGLIVIVSVGLACLGWVIPSLINMHADWALLTACLLALGTIAFVWIGLENVGSLLGFWEKKDSIDEE